MWNRETEKRGFGFFLSKQPEMERIKWDWLRHGKGLSRHFIIRLKSLSLPLFTHGGQKQEFGKTRKWARRTFRIGEAVAISLTIKIVFSWWNFRDETTTVPGGEIQIQLFRTKRLQVSSIFFDFSSVFLSNESTSELPGGKLGSAYENSISFCSKQHFTLPMRVPD